MTYSQQHQHEDVSINLNCLESNFLIQHIILRNPCSKTSNRLFYLIYIKRSTIKLIKLINCLKTDEKYSEIYTNQIISKLALNAANKTELKDIEVKLDTSEVGELIKTN